MDEKTENKAKRTLFHKVINVFIGIFVFIILLLLIFIGISQTKYFRNYLRDEITSAVNSSINGQLSIGSIDGSVFTSLRINDISLVTGGDTLVKAKSIQLETSPLEILFRKIYLRKIQLIEPDLRLVQYKNGKWNIDNLSGPEEEKAEETQIENSGGRFPYIIQINDFRIQDLYFKRKAYAYKDSSKNYKTINADDLEIKNFNIDIKSAVDIKNSVYLLHLENLSFQPNLQSFNLRQFSADFTINNDFTEIRNFNFITDSSDINLNLKLDSVNFVENPDISRFKEYPVTLKLDVKNFNFDDLTSYVDGTSLLKGNSTLYLDASGKFGNIGINKLVLDFLKTHLEISGKILNLDRPDDLALDVAINRSTLSTENAQYLLHDIQLPFIRDLIVKDVNATFKGKPTNFAATFKGSAENGIIDVDAKMNLDANPMRYNIKASTNHMDLSSIIDTKTDLTSTITAKGRGTSPEDLKSSFFVTIDESRYANLDIDSLTLSMQAVNKTIDINSLFKLSGSQDSLNARFDFNDDSTTVFDIKGKTQNLDVAKILNDTTQASDLNVEFSANGSHLDIDKMTGTLKVILNESVYKKREIDYSEIGLNLKIDNNDERRIELTSDFIDFDLFGSFSLKEAIDLVQYQSSTISDIILSKIEELNPVNLVSDSLQIASQPEIEEPAAPDVINKDLNIDYEFEFKDLDLISLVLGDSKFEVAGKGEGSINNTEDNFSVNIQLDLDYFINISKEDVTYLSNFEGDLNFIRNNKTRTFDNLFGSVSLTGNRIFSNLDFDNVNADLIFNQSKLFFNIATDVDTMFTTEIEGTLEMSPEKQKIMCKRLMIDYQDVVWTNKDTIDFSITPEEFSISNFILANQNSQISANGVLENSSRQNFKLLASDVTGSIMNKYIPGFENSNLNYTMDFQADISGNLESPLINVEMNVDTIKYGKINLGYLLCNLAYDDENLFTRFNFIDSTYNTGEPTFTLSGIVPVNLAFKNVKERFTPGRNIDLTLRSKNFNLSTFGNSLPLVKEQTGDFSADVYIGGSFDEPELRGDIKIVNGKFRSSMNNLVYAYNSQLQFKNTKIILKDISVSNLEGAAKNGTLKGSGEIDFDNFDLSRIFVNMSGNLALLGKSSKSTNPFLYGDLFVETGGDLVYKYENNNSYIQGSVLLEETDLVFSTEEAISNNSNKGIVYEFVVDSSKLNLEELKFKKLVSNKKKTSLKQDNSKSGKSFINYDLDIKIQNEAKIVFILSNVANQKLVVEAAGSLKYVTKEGETRAQGSFYLLDGSYLDFFKKFEATGNIRFESSLTDPYLDVVAYYENEWEDLSKNPPQTTPVAVKLRLVGPNSQLGQNLVDHPEYITMYVGEKNISSNTPDPQYDISNAITFILIGKPTMGDSKSGDVGLMNSVSNTATSFLGPVITNVLNSAGVSAINNVQIEQTTTGDGQGYKFNIGGRYKKFKYSLGGNVQEFRPNNADIKVEYMFNPNFSIRAQQKRPFTTISSDELIYEMGFKFKVEF